MNAANTRQPADIRDDFERGVLPSVYRSPRRARSRSSARPLPAVKHAHHAFDIDKPGKNSRELRKAGARQMLVASSRRRALVTVARLDLNDVAAVTDFVLAWPGDQTGRYAHG